MTRFFGRDGNEVEETPIETVDLSAHIARVRQRQEERQEHTGEEPSEDLAQAEEDLNSTIALLEDLTTPQGGDDDPDRVERG